MTATNFYNQLSAILEQHENRELETYLLSLLQLVDRHKEEAPDTALLLRLIEEAFIAEPAAFNPTWLAITSAPDENIMSRKFTNPAINPPFDKSVVSEAGGFDFTIAVLHFQIAELHRMRGKQLANELRYFGVDSDTGNRWYNFDPKTVLECGAQCMVDSSDDEDETLRMGWQSLGELLEMGRIYE